MRNSALHNQIIRSILIIALLLSAILVSPFSQAKVSFSFDQPSDQAAVASKQLIDNSGLIGDLDAFLNNTFITRQDVKIHFGESDNVAYYEDNKVYIPYTMVQEVEKYFAHTMYEYHRANVEEAIQDNILHTVLHEFGHALIEQYQLPVLSKEEDIADSFANFLVLTYFEDGYDIAQSAADLYYLEGKRIQRFYKQDYWGEHSLDKQRYYTMLCHIYGKDPQAHSRAREKAGFTEERAERCVVDYEILDNSWRKVLKPYLK